MPASDTTEHGCCGSLQARPLEDLLYDIETWSPASLVTEEVDLGSAVTRVIAEPVVSSSPVPPHRNSAVDGYAYRAADRAAVTALFVVGRSAAGHPWAGPPPPAGTAIRILTGAAVPDWADTVAMQEHCLVVDGTVTVPDGLSPGAHIRAAGEDVPPHTTVLRKGDRVRPQDVGMAASVGQARLRVFRRLRVAVFATGDELRSPGSALPPGCIHDSNRFVSAALFRQLGFEVTDLGIVPDRLDTIRAVLSEAAAGHDLVVTSGGVSEGDEDHVVPAIRSLGSLTSWKLAVKPGKPVAVGRIGDAVFVGLPGNPVAAMVALSMVARPLALRLAGATRLAPQTFPVLARSPIRRDVHRRQFLRGKVEHEGGALVVQQFRTDGSGVISSLTWSDGLIDVAAGTGTIGPGEPVDFIPYSELFA